MSKTATAPSALAQRVFDTQLWRADQPLRVVLIGTDFEVRVWETLLKIPMGRAVCYSDIASKINSPKASRAVGAAVGKNPISFVVPCHRALGKSGALTGYHWGITRKQAMLGWEAGQVGDAVTSCRRAAHSACSSSHAACARATAPRLDARCRCMPPGTE